MHEIEHFSLKKKKKMHEIEQREPNSQVHGIKGIVQLNRHLATHLNSPVISMKKKKKKKEKSKLENSQLNFVVRGSPEVLESLMRHQRSLN
jgi:hypothetical protein